ncbi:MAG: YfhO family protein [Flavobacteriales bacterium]|nr:YfhO family protein [Flavobacteriales bacterium]
MKKITPYIYIGICVVAFALISISYFTPVLSSKSIIQPDIVNYRGGAEELIKYRDSHGEDTYWTNSMFGGMPTYQAGAQYPMDILKSVDGFIRSFLPRPADYLFLCLAGFFFLGMVLTRNWKYALLGATMFGFSSYFFIILEAGHNAKAHTIAYFAPLLAGVYLLFNKKYIWGFITTVLFFGLELMANHPQMTYYLFFAIGAFILVQFFYSIKDRELKSYFTSIFLFVIATFLAIGMNSSRILSTYEYSKETTRGKSELVKQGEENPKSGLNKDYITNWSYGKLETLNLFIPNFMGGSSSDANFQPKELEKAIQKNIKSQEQYNKITPYLSGSPYWGEQPGTSPAYQGAIVCFLTIIGLFFIPFKHRIWLLASIVISILLAWGKNFMFLTDLFIDYVPFYDKFRAVSSFMVVPELLFPIVAMLGMYHYFTSRKLTAKYKRNILTYVGGGVLALLALFYLLGRYLFPFANEMELANLPDVILEGIKSDRITLFDSDVLRTFIFCGITLIVLFFYENRKLKVDYVLYIIIALSLIDLWSVDKRFLNDENFVSSKYMNNLFPTEINESMIKDAEENPELQRIVYFAGMNNVLNQIKERDTTNYRVFNTTYSPFNENNTSYFHHSIGGYHGAKLRRYQELVDRYFNFSSGNVNIDVLNMLNTKYILLGNPAEPEVAPNPDANGNAWFVSKLKFAKNANEELDLIDSLDSKKEVIIRNDNLPSNTQYKSDTLALIKLEKYEPNHLTYKSQSLTKQFGVFSEIYYPYGWKAYIDGELTPHYRVNYVLRGMEIPKGIHKIEFVFNPKVVYQGKLITVSCFILFLILSILGIIWKNKERIIPAKNETTKKADEL